MLRMGCVVPVAGSWTMTVRYGVLHVGCGESGEGLQMWVVWCGVKGMGIGVLGAVCGVWDVGCGVE